MADLLEPEVLVIATKFDFSTDNICYQLNRREANYLRLNRDDLQNFTITMDPRIPIIRGERNEFSFILNPNKLRSIYFRAPTFIRDTFNRSMSFEDQLCKSQWAAFIRSLVVFENVKWINNPINNYESEIKPYQLFVAHRLGLTVPDTVISNGNEKGYFEQIKTNTLAIKTIDTGHVSSLEYDAFIYTSFVEKGELKKYSNQNIPFIAQEALLPKIDIRVTVVGNKVFPVSITSINTIQEDWRLKKNDLIYKPYSLPTEVSEKCVKLVQILGLNFGGIDLVYSNQKYYFIEINPTGEWDWLMYNTGLKIDEAICDFLLD